MSDVEAEAADAGAAPAVAEEEVQVEVLSKADKDELAELKAQMAALKFENERLKQTQDPEAAAAEAAAAAKEAAAVEAALAEEERSRLERESPAMAAEVLDAIAAEAGSDYDSDDSDAAPKKHIPSVQELLDKHGDIRIDGGSDEQDRLNAVPANKELSDNPRDWKEFTDEMKITAPRSSIFETRLKASDALRTVGNLRYKADDLDMAVKAYERALWHADFDEAQVMYELHDDHRENLAAFLVPIHLNTARCHTRKGNDALAREAAGLAIENARVCHDEDDLGKALYLRGRARLNLGSYKDAREDLDEAKTHAFSYSLGKFARDVRAAQWELRAAEKQLAAELRKGWGGTMTSGDAVDPAAPPSFAQPNDKGPPKEDCVIC